MSDFTEDYDDYPWHPACENPDAAIAKLREEGDHDYTGPAYDPYVERHPTEYDYQGPVSERPTVGTSPEQGSLNEPVSESPSMLTPYYDPLWWRS